MRGSKGAMMVIEPVFGLVKHFFSLDRFHLDWFVAAAIIACTLLYLTRILGISVVYGMGGKSSIPLESSDAELTEPARTGPSLAR